jgi:hypothetical protein
MNNTFGDNNDVARNFSRPSGTWGGRDALIPGLKSWAIFISSLPGRECCGTLRLLTTLSIALVTATPAFSSDTNLVKNGDFTAGDKYPAHWDKLDGLTMFWEKDPTRGKKCIRLFTNVSNDQFLLRYDQMKLDPVPPPPKQQLCTPPGYDSVGGNDGVHYFSEYIEIKPGMKYTLSCDCRSDTGGAPKIFIKGYTEQMTEIADEQGKAKTVPLRRITYKGDFDFPAPKEWKTSSFTFSPTGQRDDVQWIKVAIWAYWTPQNYWFDNVKVVEAGPDKDAPARWAKKKQAKQDAVDKEINDKIRETRAGLAYLRKGIDQFKADTGLAPPSLQALLKDPGIPKWSGPYVIEIGEDAWGQAWVYQATGGTYSLHSIGPDGKDNTGDEVE